MVKVKIKPTSNVQVVRNGKVSFTYNLKIGQEIEIPKEHLNFIQPDLYEVKKIKKVKK